MINPRMSSVRMSMAGTGLIARKGITVQDWDFVGTSLPGFIFIVESMAG